MMERVTVSLPISKELAKSLSESDELLARLENDFWDLLTEKIRENTDKWLAEHGVTGSGAEPNGPLAGRPPAGLMGQW